MAGLGQCGHCGGGDAGYWSGYRTEASDYSGERRFAPNMKCIQTIQHPCAAI
jgi:hypothetical protein